MKSLSRSPHPRSLVQPLFEGPIDVVGDVHGEIDALNSLLVHLGYSADGSHSDRRRLVFVGDLTDRGPDSPAVVRTVKRLFDLGVAQCVLGNHDLNILLGDKKHDNHWFFGEEWSLDKSNVPTPAVLADDQIREEVLSFLRTLPLVLEGESMRVVHACWDGAMVDVARRATNVLELYRQFRDQISVELICHGDMDRTNRALAYQNRNPVKVLTSGLERKASQPFVSSGKLRNEERVPWWDNYQDQAYCVFGHYGMVGAEALPGRAICVDFGVAKRWEERKQLGFNGRYKAKLGAIRLDAGVVVFDDGSEERPKSPWKFE